MENGREGVDFLIEENQLYMQSIDLRELKDNLFVVLVLIIDKKQRFFI